MDIQSKQERRVGHVHEEKDLIDKAVVAMEDELGDLSVRLASVLRSGAPTTTCDENEPDARTDCALASELSRTRRQIERLSVTICDLKDRLEV